MVKIGYFIVIFCCVVLFSGMRASEDNPLLENPSGSESAEDSVDLENNPQESDSSDSENDPITQQVLILQNQFNNGQLTEYEVFDQAFRMVGVHQQIDDMAQDPDKRIGLEVLANLYAPYRTRFLLTHSEAFVITGLIGFLLGLSHNELIHIVKRSKAQLQKKLAQLREPRSRPKLWWLRY